MEELTPPEIDDLLYQQGFGILGLSADDVPYVFPMSFGYDGERCFIQMSASGRKNDVLESNRRAGFTALSVDYQTGISESVVLDGVLEPVPEAEKPDAMAALADNAHFGQDLEIWSKPMEDVTLRIYQFLPDNRSGRRFGEEMVLTESSG